MILKKVSIVALLLLLLSSCGKKQNTQSKEVPTYPVTNMSAQSATLESAFPATIKGKEDIDIKPRVDGSITNIYVDEGTRVKRGQSLFRIDSPQSQQALTSAQAAVLSAQAALNTAEVNVARIRPLAEKGIVSHVQLQTYENAYQSAKASLAQSRAVLSQAQSIMGWTNVISPVDGVVGVIPFRQGSVVSIASVLTTVASTDEVYAYFSMNEKELMALLNNLDGTTQAQKIKNLPEVSLILADGSTYPEKGHIETISGLVDISTGSVNFRALFPNKNAMLRSGSSGKVSIPETLNNVFVIPQKATFAQQDKILVYKLVGDSAVQHIISALPMPDGQRYAVTSGISENDRIISDGVATIRNGMKIKAQ